MSEEKIGEILDKHKLAKPDLWKDLKVFCDSAKRQGYLEALGDVEEVLRSAPPMLGLAFMRDLEQLKARAGGELSEENTNSQPEKEEG